MLHVPLERITADEETLLFNLKYYKEQGTLPDDSLRTNSQ